MNFINFKQDYLVEAGYLQQRDAKMTTNQTDFVQALMQFQYQKNLPSTGIVDNPTTVEMQKPRCGIPNTVSNKKNNKMHVPVKLSGKNNNLKQVLVDGGNGFSAKSTGLAKGQPPFSYFVSKDTVPSYLTVDLVYEALEFAFNRWSSVANVQFLRGELLSNPDIIIGFYSGE